MTLGNFEHYFVPVLKALNVNGKTHFKENINQVALAEKVSESDLALRSAKGTSSFRTRVYWAQAFLFQAGAVTRPERGFLEITERGLKLLEENPDGFRKSKFREFPDYADAWGRGKKNEDTEDSQNSLETPQEQIDSAIEELENSVAIELVQKIRNQTPKFLELVVLELLRAMGYGASDSSIEHLGGPGDEGVDGVINQDALGLQRIYIQAKRYKSDNTIGRPSIQSFMGALSGLGANGGVFITTSSFSNDAREYVSKNISPRIVLIDAHDLGKLLVHHGIGVHAKKTYQVFEIDEDYFEE
jgi:restriction system protein